MTDKLIIKANDAGIYALPNIAMGDVDKVDIVDVDLVLRTKDGQQIVLPGAGLSAMSEKPYEVAFQDTSISTSILLQRVSSALTSVDSDTMLTSQTPDVQQAPTPTTPSPTQEEIKEAIDKAVKEAIKETKAEDEKEHHKHDSESSGQTASISTDTESTVEQMVEKAQQLIENLHTSDYKYNPPHEFTPPPEAAASPPGVPPPISLTPVTTLFMGNMVGTTYDTTSMPGTTIIYGGGGAVGSNAAAEIGPRNSLQFSAAAIAGTAGDDLIYAQGPSLGNANPAVSTAMYAKEFLLNVAGYFITLDDVKFSGVPAGVSIVGATDNGGGNWTLPANDVIKQNTFSIVYNSASTGSFDIVVDVTGKTTRAEVFHSKQNFRFEYLNVTDVSQVTDQSLIYEDKGRLQEIYILPTQDQPNSITLSTGTDTVYGGRNNDTITGGNGDKTIYAREGDDTITIGNGNNQVDLGSGNNAATTGSGDDTISALGGNNIIQAGDGINHVTLGAGVNSVTTGTGADTIIVGDGNSTIVAGDGINSITGGIGFYTITSGSNDDTITLTSGGGSINAGNGVNNINAGAGNYTITTGIGDDIIVATNGNNIIQAGDGANQVTLGAGVNNVTTGSGGDIILVGNGNSTIAAGDGINSITGGVGFYTITSGSNNDMILLTSGGGSINAGNGVNNINAGAGNYNITTGSGGDTIVVGNGNSTISAGDGNNSVTVGAGTNTITAGTGNDTLSGSTGNDTFRAGLGTNSITGGGGTDTLDYSTITTTGITASMVAGTTTGTGLSDTFTGITNLTATTNADTVTGSTASETIRGGNGGDTITGGGGTDTIYGESGDDILTGNTGNDTIYGGTGNNTISGGASGADFLYGGTGNDTFTSPHSGTRYFGTDAATLAAGELNTINYSSQAVDLNINLATGLGIGGGADGSVYGFTSNPGFNSINGIAGGSGNDTITGSSSNDTLNGGAGSDTLTGGAGTNTLIGGAGGNDNYYMGGGSDTVTGSASSYDSVFYSWNIPSSPAGVVINLTSSTQSYLNSLGVTRTVAAFSGDNFGVTAADATSYSNGDRFTVVSGTSTSIDRLFGSGYADLIYAGTDYLTYYNSGGNDVVFAGTGGMTFLGYEQNDTFYGNSNNDDYYFSNGRDLTDGSTGFNVLHTNSSYSGDYNVVVYLDASADTNSNGVADSIDRGVGSLVSGGVTYTGFEYGWGNATTGATSTLIKNYDNVIGNSANDYTVGNNNVNQINARGGINTIYGMGGDDIITAIEGTNTIDGGIGNDLVNFQFQNNGISGSLAQNSPNFTYGVQVFLADGAFLGASDKTSYWGTGFSIYQARTGDQGTGAFSYNTITNVENINGSDYNDVLYGNSAANVIYGNSGDDVIAGNGGADTLRGGAGNDTFRVTASDTANVLVFDGSTGTDILYAPGFTFAAGSISNSKYLSIETVDARNSVTGETYGLSATDVQSFVDNGTASTLQLKLDNGDNFTPTGFFTLSGSGSDFTYRYYSEAGHINQIAMLNVHYGAG